MTDNFLTNSSNVTFLEKVKKSLQTCNKFFFSVSFIKKAGLVLFAKDIEDALKRGVVGKIVTSTYQNFTDIPSLQFFSELMRKYPNFDVRVDYHSFGENGFHTKGYMFENNDYKELIIGSSNITRFALLFNMEWDISLEDRNDKIFGSYDLAKQEFDYYWNACKVLDKDLINNYKAEIDVAITRWDMDYYDPQNETLSPNMMQRKALKEIRRYRDLGSNKALVVSATGSGKTFLAAFDARNFDAKKLLFIVHRDAILVSAQQTFAKIFGTSRSYGLYTGNIKDLDVDFLFATNTSMSEHINEFDPKEFDYIVLDEAHHATADTYRTIMNYFKPEFMLGLTATPERMDNEDVFKLFGKNVPYELRLRDAINNDLIVPFRYYGIRDTLINYDTKDINESKLAKQLTSDDHVDFIVDKIKEHLTSSKLKAVAFCSSVGSALSMAEQFNDRGFNAIALSGDSQTGQRVKAFKDLQDEDNPLQIICTVDILNEGVDIPAINMVLFLRPTKSSTIFIQQLGRGLRKYPDKEFLTVLDFIGNSYNRATQIALALGSMGVNTYTDKKTLQEQIRSDYSSLGIKGVEIHIDDLAKEDILAYINGTNFNKRDFIEQDYNNFKIFLNKENSYPTHLDYLNNDSAPDLIRFMKCKISNKKNFSYYSFLLKIGEKNIPIFNDDEIKFLDTLSDYLPLVRPDEYLIVKEVINDGLLNLDKLDGLYRNVTKDTLKNAVHYLNSDKILFDNKLVLNSFSVGFLEFLNDLLNYGLSRYDQEFGDYEGIFKPYRNYYKEQIMKNLLENSSNFMKGTKFDTYNKYTYIFVGLKKDKDKTERMNYKDKFLSSNIFQWESENNTTFTNSTGKKILDTKKVFIFVRKMDEEDGITLPFTYIGTGVFSNIRESYVISKDSNGNDKKVSTLLMDVKLDEEVPLEYRFEFNVPEEKK